ncbi:MAG TPA: phage tail tip lysozyme [Trebonia sp.]
MTAGTRRNGSSKFGLFRWSPARGGDEENGYFSYDDSPDRADAEGDEAPEGHAGADADHDGDQGHEQKPGRRAERYTGRHASPRGKAARKLRVGKVVPAAAVAAAVAAGTAAYGLSSGGPSAAPLNASAAIHGALDGRSKAGTSADSAELIKGATSAVTSTAKPAPKHAAKPAVSHTPKAAPSAPHAAAATKAPAPAATKAASQPAKAATLSCNVNYGLLPQNVTAIVSFLLANGYSDNAAAGIAGNIYQESKGNPESEGMGGGGLIGWTPLPSDFVTGDVTADLETQLNALLTYNQGWASYVPELNAAASPSDAAYIYVTDFERAGIPAASTRESAAQDVASACGI